MKKFCYNSWNHNIFVFKGKVLKAIIDNDVVYLSRDVTIHGAIVKMKDEKKSCSLIVDETDQVVGILTERDIFRKIALLDVEDKLLHKVSTIMTTPVKFTEKSSMIHQIKKQHKDYGFRHFPIIKDNALTRTKEDILGIVSDTSIFKYYIYKI